jgi:HPt (histidine-containing phosphotransfer) domain-containing protein
LLGAGLVAAGLTVLLLLLARLYIISPLRALHMAVSRLQAGGKPGDDGLRELPLEARNEVGDLARAFVDMAHAIERRELAIAAQNREMRLVLESVGQGFLLLCAAGRVVGQHSAIVEKWFGAVPSGQPLWEQLAGHDAVQAEWLELAWSNIGAPMMPLELCLEQLPKRFEAKGRSYDFEYRPSCTASGELERMVVIISDVTELVARERAEREQRELAAVLGSIAADRSGFMSFFEEASALLKRIVAANPGSRHQLLEDIHTLKGNAGLFHMRSLASLCEAAETRLAAEGGLLNEAERTALLQCFERTAAVVEPLTAPGEQRELALSVGDYEAIEAALRRRDAAEDILLQLARTTAEPAELLFRRFASRLEVLARGLGKCPLDVRAQGNGLRFPKLRFAPLWAALVHALRNIADHALETPAERAQAGKPPRALVEMSAEQIGDKLLIRLCDDGRGVDLELVAARAAQLGLNCEGERELLDTLFASGLSAATEHTKLSGRGVGLSALKSAVIELGGQVSMRSRRGHGSELRIELPSQLL